MPGQDFTADAVAALAALPVADAGNVLERLVTGNLVIRTSGRRYQLHDLLRLYATELCVRHDAGPVASAATVRLFEFYVRTVDAAADQLFPLYKLLPRPPASPAVSPVRFADTAAATAWMERECLNAFDVVTAAVADGRPEFAWLLAETTRAYLVTSGRYRAEALSAVTVALDAAVAAGDRSVSGGMRYSLGSIHLHHGAARLAAEQFTEAVRDHEEIGDLFGQVRARIILGRAYDAAGRLDMSADQIRGALELAGSDVQPAMVLHGWVNLSHVEMLRGDLALSEQAAAKAFELLENDKLEHDMSRTYEGSLREIIGNLLVRRGRCADAIDELRQAIACYGVLSVPFYQTQATAALSMAYRELGDLAAAVDHARTAMRLAATDDRYDSDIDALLVLADVQRTLGQHDEAGANYGRALDLCQRLVHARRKAGVLRGDAENNRALGHLDTAAELADRAVTVAGRCGYQGYHVQAMTVAARIWLDRDDPDRAGSVAGDAVLAVRRLGARLDEAYAGHVLGSAQWAAGSPDRARRSWQAAAHAVTGTDLPDTAEIRRRLAAAQCYSE